MGSAFQFLISTVANLYMSVFLLRIILHWVRADFYNPFSQFVLRATRPLVAPLRRIVPRTRSFDLSAFLVLIVLECIVTAALALIAGAQLPVLMFVRFAALRLLFLTLWLYTFAIFVYVILSWIPQSGYNPVASVLSDVVSPVLRPVRRWLPLMGGLDLSPLIVLIAIQFALRLLPGVPWYLV